MSRTFVCATALALSLGGLAHAQGAGSYAAPPAAAPATPDASSAPASPDTSATPAASSAADFKPGMPVKDGAGQTVGTIKRVGQTSTGTPAAELTVDGKPIVLALADLTLAPTGKEAISKRSKSELKAAQGGQTNP
jgi:hypothetical protein